MRTTLPHISLIVCLFLVAVVSGGEPPSPEHPVGWRGDGTGKYLDTTPVFTWERTVKTPLATMTGMAQRPPKDGAAGGAQLIRARSAFSPVEWLILGTIDVGQADKAIDTVVLPNEADFSPDENERAGDMVWKRAKAGLRGIDFLSLYGKAEQRSIVYLFTYLYAPTEMEAGLQVHGDHDPWKFWVNGKAENSWDMAHHHFNAGWNRLLIKVGVRANVDTSNIDVRLTVLAGPKLEYETKNILWATQMPGSGYGMPICIREKLIMTSEPNEVLCVDKKTGRILWLHSDALWYAASKLEPADGPVADMKPSVEKLEAMEARYIQSQAEVPADIKTWEQRKNTDDARRKLAQELTDGVKKINRKYGVSLGWGGGNCGPTPVSDGHFVYVWHGESGVLSCFDLDGKRVYTRFAHSGSGGEHGVNASPQIAGDKIVVIGGQKWLCFNKETGDLLWTQKYAHACYGTAALAKVGGEEVAIAPDGQIVRLADGSIIQKAYGPYDGEIASVVREGEKFYLIARGGFCEGTLPASFANGTLAPMTCKLAPAEVMDAEVYPVGSPVVLDGLFYATHSGWSAKGFPVLIAIDPKEKKAVYHQRLEMTPELHYGPDGAGVAASLALAGGKFFVMDNRGATIVFEPGREFKQISKNVIEHITRQGRQEITESTPIFDGARMYYRGEENLYCVGK